MENGKKERTNDSLVYSHGFVSPLALNPCLTCLSAGSEIRVPFSFLQKAIFELQHMLQPNLAFVPYIVEVRPGRLLVLGLLWKGIVYQD